jgi:hypothetical protein
MPNTLTTTCDVSLFDIVRLRNGEEFVVTGIKRNRPANPFVGVKVNGRGTEYKFGPKHGPVVIGKAQTGHPALIARDAKAAERGRERLDPCTANVKGLYDSLLTAVEEGNYSGANVLVAAIRVIEQSRK